MGEEIDVLIVGVGPTGLVLAHWLSRLGVNFRIIDSAATAGETSRALVVHARTLEFYDQIGLAQEVVDRGVKAEAIRMWARGRQRARLMFGDIGQGLSPFPFFVILPQDEHERLLVDALHARGVTVERPRALAAYEAEGDGVAARIDDADGGRETIRARFLAGCDGAHSRVREGMAPGFPGGTYSRLYYVADVEAEGEVVNGDLNIALDDADFLAVFPMAGQGRVRLVGDIERTEDHLTFEDVGHQIFERLGLRVSRVNWFSSYRVHHRVAQFWRKGGAFLLGDAAHIHSPVGGQGMNTGIGDAVNLAWKLAEVIRGRAAAALLDTYEPERIAFARRLVATTDRAFNLISRDGALARFVRTEAAPSLLPVAFGVTAVRRWMFRTVSQIGIQYRAEALSQGSAGGVSAGDRLPWVGAGGGNFKSLSRLTWQAHVYGEADGPTVDACRALGLALERFTWTEQASRAGIERDALYLVRPDGYVALAANSGVPVALNAFWRQWGLRA